MGYRELLQALEDEVGREIRQLQASASAERERLLDATRRELAGAREAALGGERRRLAEESGRALARARLDQEGQVLDATRRWMEALRLEAEARLPARGDGATTARLFDEIAPELGEGRLELRVREGQEERFREHLLASYPQLLSRASVRGSAEVSGGVAATLDGREVLDNTLLSRLGKAWPLLEPEIAARLFAPEAPADAVAAAVAGEGHDRL